jgi:hypothetical protein
MSKCEEVIEQLQCSLDVPGGQPLSDSARQHLASCTSCAATAHSLQQLHSQLQEPGNFAGDLLPHGFHQRLLQKLNTEPAHKSSIWQLRERAWYPSLVAAAAMLALFVLVRNWNAPVQNGEATAPIATARPAEPTAEQVAAGAALVSLTALVADTEIPTPERLYADAAPAVSDFTGSLYDAAAALTQPIARSSNSSLPSPGRGL